MAKQLKYWGEFVSVEGVMWRMELHEESNGIDITSSEIFFPPNPLTIDWANSDKLEVIEASSATLIVESDTDRRFIDLYKVEVGAVLLKVFRQGELYWSGTLDTELYEEPYSYNNHYDVTLTFADFAPLERIKWNMTGFISKHDVVVEALSKSGIAYTAIEKYISTILINHKGATVDLTKEFDLCENYYDEDGEPMTVLEVLKESLKPLALKIKQKNGKINISDINCLAGKDAKLIEWEGTDAVLGVDTTYNNVTLEFSPYADATIIDGGQSVDIISKGTSMNSRMIHTDISNDDWQWTSPEGFKISVGTKGGDNLTLGGGAKFFCIAPEYSGSSEAGVAYTAKTYNFTSRLWVNIGNLKEPHNCNAAGPMIMKSTSKFIASAAEYALSGFKLKVELDLLFDVRYNPFEQAQIENEEGWWRRLQDWSNFAYVPVKIYIKNDKGAITHHYSNSETVTSDGYQNRAGWKVGEPTWQSCYLAYYDTNNRRSASGLGGWKANKPCIGYYQGGLPSAFETMGDGENIPLPPVSGWLTIEVGAGVLQFDYEREVKNIYEATRWILYKGPTVKIIRENGRDYQPEDIEIKAWINTSAKEDLTIETISGTMPTPSPSARGLVFDSSCKAASGFNRANNSDTLERLLLCTAYSQYAGRNNTLSGTVKLLDSFDVYCDANTSGKYMLLGEMQSPYNDTSEVLLVEIQKDNYRGVKYE